MSYYIYPSADSLKRALDSWRWIGIGGKKPVLVTSFADVFFAAEDGIWFLDTLEGTFERTHSSKEEVEKALESEEARDRYLFAGYVERAVREGCVLQPGQCYDFKLHPKVGGPIEYANVEVCDFVVALNIRGQIHEQVRHMPDGARISKFVVSDESARKKPWWRFW